VSINRTHLRFERDFVQIPNRWMRDTRLSRKARGLLAELMTHSVGWSVTLESLVDGGPEGRDAVRTAVIELEEAGYLVRTRQRAEDGRLLGINYDLQDPEDPDQPVSDNPTVGQQTLVEVPLKKTKPLEDHPEENQEPSLARKRATRSRVPADFFPSDGSLAWAKAKYPKLNVSRETDKFIGHHLAKGSLFKDWQQAWRNWIDRAAEWSEPTSIRPTAVQPTQTDLDPYGDPRWA
jgi:hypothetical protein